MVNKIHTFYQSSLLELGLDNDDALLLRYIERSWKEPKMEHHAPGCGFESDGSYDDGSGIGIPPYVWLKNMIEFLRTPRGEK